MIPLDALLAIVQLLSVLRRWFWCCSFSVGHCACPLLHVCGLIDLLQGLNWHFDYLVGDERLAVFLFISWYVLPVIVYFCFCSVPLVGHVL